MTRSTKRMTWLLLVTFFFGLLLALPGTPAQASSSTHRLTWVSGSFPTTISADKETMTSSPSQNHSTEHVLNLNFSFTGNAKEGKVQIRLPYQIFKDRDGNQIGTTTIPLLQAPQKPDSGFRFNYYIDELTNEIVISNTEDIVGNFALTIDIKYNVLPSDVKMTLDADNQYVYSKDIEAIMTVDPLDGPPESYTSNTATIDYKTKVTLDALSKSRYSTYSEWPTALGAKPADADDYFYVAWSLYANASTNDTMPFWLHLREINPDGPEYGELIGFSDRTSTGIRQGTLADFNAFFNPYQTPITRPVTSSSANRSYWNPYVYYRYPKSLLVNNKATVKNIVEAETVGFDGMTSKRTASASLNVNLDPPTLIIPGDIASMTKTNSGISYGMINNILEKVKQPWILTRAYPAATQQDGNFSIYNITAKGWRLSQDGDEFGVKDYTIELTDDNIGYEGGTPSTYHQLTDGDYQFTKFRFSGYTEYAPVVTATAYSDTPKPVSEHRPIEVLVQKNGVWSVHGSIIKYLQGSSTRYSFTPVTGTPITSSGSMHIPLPEGTTGLRLKHVTNSVRVTYTNSIYIETQLLDSAAVRDMVEGREEAYVHNRAVIKTYSDTATGHTGSASSRHKLTRLKFESIISKDRSTPVEDLSRQRYYVNYTVSASDYVINPGDMTWDEIIARNHAMQQRQSTFYDLLPPGTSVDLSTIKVTGYHMTTPFSHRLELHDNWKGSGRTMLIVHAQAPEGVENYYKLGTGNAVKTLYSGMTLTFRMYNTWSNVVDNGITLVNYAAYESHDGPLGNGQPDVPNISFLNSTLRNAMTDLNQDGNPDGRPNNFLYSQVSFTYTPLRAFETGFGKTVASPADPAFDEHTDVLPGGRYTYRLRINDPSLKLKDLVFYDVLETAQGSNPSWKGSLVGVDISHALAKNIDAKVYYATSATLSDGDIMADRLHLDNNPGVWNTSPPGDMSTVTAVAIDLRKLTNGQEYIASPQETVLVNINMQAPVDNLDVNLDRLAYNRGIMALRKSDFTGNVFDDVVSIEACNPVTVGLKEMGLAFDKRSDPPTGTSAAPRPVYGGNTLIYYLDLTNNNVAQTITNVTLEDIIPNGLTIDTANVSVMLDDNPTSIKPVHESTRVHMILDTTGGLQKLIFSITSLAAQEKITIKIPTTVNRITADDAPVDFDNQAHVTRIFGKPFALDSQETHHKAFYTKLPLAGKKVLTGRDVKKSDSFTFLLKDSDGQVIKTYTLNDTEAAAGEALDFFFTDLFLDRPGTFTYTISEEKGSLESMVYDLKVITLTVTVTPDPNTGELTANAVYSGDIVFNNEFEGTTFAVTKNWKTSDGSDLPQPLPSVRLALYRDGVLYDEYTMKDWEDGNDGNATTWIKTWNDLPKYHPDGTTEYVYTARELYPPPNFRSIKVSDSEITNIYTPGVFTANKQWRGPSDEIDSGVPILLQLKYHVYDQNDNFLEDRVYGNPVPIDGETDSVDTFPREISPWTVQWEELPANNNITGDGAESYVYFITEQGLPADYLLDIEASNDRRLVNIKNTVSFTATKIWENGPEERPDVKLQLTRYNPITDKYDDIDTPVTLESGKLSYTWTGLERFYRWDANDPEQRIEHKYSFREIQPVENYTPTHSEDGLSVTNSYEIPKTTVQARKFWVNGPAEDHTGVMVNLFRKVDINDPNEAPELVFLEDGRFHLTEEPDGSFTYEWRDIEKTTLDGKPYTYFAVEAGLVNGKAIINGNSYTVTTDETGLMVTNNYDVPLTNIYAIKLWRGGPDEDHNQVQLDLFRKTPDMDEPVEVTGVTPEVDGPEVTMIDGMYFYTWTDLALTDENGALYTYYARERGVVDDKILVNGNTYEVVQEGLQVTNTYQIPLRDVVATKAWQGGPVTDHTAVTLTLLQDGATMEPQPEPVITGTAPNFTYTWKDLPVTDIHGKTYDYGITEADAVGNRVVINGNHYEVSADGRDLTNTYLPPAEALVEITAQKLLRNKDLAAGDFSFQLLDSKGAVIATVQNDADGLITFPPQPVSQLVDELVYQIREVPGSDSTISYDQSTYTLTFQVTLDNNRYLDTLVKLEKNGTAIDLEAPLTFTNTYTAPEPSDPPVVTYPPISVQLPVSKQLRNGTLKAGQFQFELRDRSGKVLASASNDSAGNVRFPDRTFSRVVSNYIYTIHEVQGTDSLIQYDGTVFTVKVSTRAVDGQLVATMNIERNGTPYAGNMVFTNVKKSPATGDPMITLILLLSLGAVAVGAAYVMINRRRPNQK